MGFDWDLARTFLTVADEGSLSAAARALGQTQPTISRQIAAFETALDATLFERTGRSVALTPFGVELLDHVRAMAAGADMVSLAAMGQSQSVAGQVRITASELLSAFVLPPILREIRDLAPLLEVDIVADNGIRDLARREADIAIRHVRPEQPNLLTRRLRAETMRFYASHSYLDAQGMPDMASLGDHQIISYVEADRMLGYLRPAGFDLTRANVRFTTSSQYTALELARAGLGVIILPVRMAATLPDLREVLGDMAPFEVPTWLVTHQEMKTSRRIRLVFDHLVERLS
ncbi:LysR family transcriptional regulator [Dinoroseobacter sp. S375]|uniref:LysR family transcriptional regulator n=1 Tax=Dinoroseobacter sp. S375 TaxID=3415136 RepID=UPI003C7A7C33